MGFPTTYRFEYGPSTSYGQVSPPGGASVGEGHGPVPVTQQLTGLQPGVTYHFRVVATNEWGTEVTDDSTFNFFPQDCPNAYARQLTRAAYLPDCRAYELVSPGNASAIELYPGDVTEDLFFYTIGRTHHPPLQDRSPECRHGEKSIPILLLGSERGPAGDQSSELPSFSGHLHLDPHHERVGDAVLGTARQ